MPLDIYDEQADESPEHAGAGRPYVCIFFECCNVYARIYRRPEHRVYQGRCPKCLRTVRLRVGPGGTPERFFRAK